MFTPDKEAYNYQMLKQKKSLKFPSIIWLFWKKRMHKMLFSWLSVFVLPVGWKIAI